MTDAPPPRNEPPESPAPEASPRIRGLQKVGVLLFCAAYLAATAFFLGRQVLGDSIAQEASYFFTWDMFPDYETESARRMVLGLTDDGRFVQLLPAAEHRFRWGVDGTVSRIDIDRRTPQLDEPLKRQIDRFEERRPGNPIHSVLVVEQFWPNKFNLPGDLYESTYGERLPRRRHWRILLERPLNENGDDEHGVGDDAIQSPATEPFGAPP